MIPFTEKGLSTLVIKLLKQALADHPDVRREIRYEVAKYLEEIRADLITFRDANVAMSDALREALDELEAHADRYTQLEARLQRLETPK